MKVLIIAAGNGKRLRRFGRVQPKPLYKVAGLPLIERTLLTAKKAGIHEFVIVVGYLGGHIQRHLEKQKEKLGVSITFVTNPDWKKPNGYSVQKAEPYLQDDFILLMADHVFDDRILKDLLQHKPPSDGVLLALDERVKEIFDLPDATKVKTVEGSIVQIGKSLSDYDAIDTGIFYCSPAIFGALQKVCQDGGGGLSEAIGELASRGKAHTYLIGKRYWQDVDTMKSLRQAEKMLIRSVRKPETDGIISRHLNRPISGFISRFLVKTPLTANQITYSSLVIGLLSAFFVSKGRYWEVVLGGFLFQFASIYDGCDGEVAKLKMTASKFGEWLDTICDNITYLAFLVGVLVGAAHQGFKPVLISSILMTLGVSLTLALLFIYLVKWTHSGSLVTIQKGVSSYRPIQFMIKRDFFALLFMLLCFLNRLDVIITLAIVGSNLAWIILVRLMLAIRQRRIFKLNVIKTI